MAVLQKRDLIERIRERINSTIPEAQTVLDLVEDDDGIAVENALEGDEESLEDVLAIAERVFRIYQLGVQDGERRGAPRSRSITSRDSGLKEFPGDFSELATEEERKRAEILSYHYGIIAESLPQVTDVRHALGGSPLMARDAWVLLESPLAAHLPMGLIRDLALDPLDNAWHKISSSSDEVVSIRNVRFPANPPVTIDKQPPEGVISWWDYEGRKRETVVYETSFLAWLSSISQRLGRAFGWRQEDATWFLLTGKRPALPFIRVRLSESGHPRQDSNDFHRVHVEVRAESWVSPGTVTRVYNFVRSELSRASGSRRIKGLKKDTLELVSDIDQILRNDPGMSQRRAAHLWNTSAASERKFPDPKHVQQAYSRGLRSVLVPPHKIPPYAFGKEGGDDE